MLKEIERQIESFDTVILGKQDARDLVQLIRKMRDEVLELKYRLLLVQEDAEKYRGVV
jgi:Mg2+ and Co2+ transporter CorA